jgi:hypothetical protein
MERCTSYGRGGAGNLRMYLLYEAVRDFRLNCSVGRASEAKVLEDTMPWTQEEGMSSALGSR